jgi:hypothetical protein
LVCHFERQREISLALSVVNAYLRDLSLRYAAFEMTERVILLAPLSSPKANSQQCVPSRFTYGDRCAVGFAGLTALGDPRSSGSLEMTIYNLVLLGTL